MRKLATTVVGMAVLCGMAAFAQTQPQPPVAQHEHILYAHGEAEVMHIAIMESQHDPVTVKLLQKALADRKAFLHAEIERAEKQEAVVKAMESGNKEEIQKAREDLKDSKDEVVAKAKAFTADFKTIRDHLGIKMAGPRPPTEKAPAPKE
jgi:hypothetical protein